MSCIGGLKLHENIPEIKSSVFTDKRTRDNLT